MHTTITLLTPFIILANVFAEPRLQISNLILTTSVPPGESTRKDRMDTIYDEPIGVFTDVSQKLTPQDIEEFFDRDRRKKWSSPKPFSPNSSWKATTTAEEPTTIYKTDTAVFTNDPIELEFQQMPGKAKVFFEDSGIPLVTTKPIVHPFSTDTEITMTMATLSDKSAPEMAEKHLEIRTLPPLIINDLPEEDTKTKEPISFHHQQKERETAKSIALESALDIAAIPKLHYDVQRLIEEVSSLKILVGKLVMLHAKERKRELKKRRNSRKVNGTSAVVPPGSRLTATQTQDQASTDHFIHYWKDVPQKRKSTVYGLYN